MKKIVKKVKMKMQITIDVLSFIWGFVFGILSWIVIDWIKTRNNAKEISRIKNGEKNE